MNISDYKGILIICAVVVAILFYSKDLECVMLMTGIIVNIIAICLNTGVTKFTNNELPKNYLPAKRFDLMERITGKNKSKESIPPRDQTMNAKHLSDQTMNAKHLSDQTMDASHLSDEKKSIDRPLDSTRYPGAVNWDEDEMYQETGTDMIPDLSVKRQGINTKRQISGAMKRRRVLQPYIAAELTDVEHLPWWGQMDY